MDRKGGPSYCVNVSYDPERERRETPLFDRPNDEELERLYRLSAEQTERDYDPIHPEPAWRSFLRKLWAPIAFVGFLLWKLKFVVAAIFKFKLFTVAGSMIVSVGAYALLWGWQFAAGFVLLLFVHELGHVIEARRQGLPASAPLFIPFLGAMIALKELPDDAWKEARVALAGPIVGSLGAAVTWGIGEALDSELLVALAFTGFLLEPLQPPPDRSAGRGAVQSRRCIRRCGRSGCSACSCSSSSRRTRS